VAIHEEVQVLKQGLICRVGTDETIDAWNEIGFLVMVDFVLWRPSQGTAMTVSAFIDTPTATWNEEKLHQYLLSIDVEIILHIRLSGRWSSDI
jgi:hypothetical protein